MTEKYKNVYFITGNAYAGKSTMVHLLAQKYDGIECGENYHNSLLDGLNKDEFPCLTYTRDLQDWHDFVRRSPQEYADWIAGAAKECEILELQILNELCEKNPEKKIFVDTNICVETLHQIVEKNHVLIMLAPPETSVKRFFERPDKEKQFIYQLLMEEPDPQAAMENYRQTLMLINSQENYEALYHSGFNVLLRDEVLGIDGTLAKVEELFRLAEANIQIKQILQSDEKEKISRCILEALPDWFEVEESREEYIKNSGDKLFFAAFDGENPIGFLYLKETGKATVELAVMGVLKQYHRQGVGRKIFNAAKECTVKCGYEFMQVKTVKLGVYEDYDRTNYFYQSLGFKEFEVFPLLWDKDNPCQIYVMRL